ncbi:MAG: hypothetical protein MJ236_02510 [Clostridia bacterium]|nr:hypothetical protein [Clostridia bacterium]
MQLQDFFDYKNTLMEDLLTNKRIVELLVDETSEFEDAAGLAYTQVFPYEYIPETVSKGQTFICFDVDIQQTYDKTFYAPILYIWVFSHRSRLRLPEGGVRPDSICAEICKTINGSRKYGLGELNFYSSKRFAPMTDYQGKVLTFHMKEFNRIYDGKKYTPVNRKEE